ncbi:fasciclin domain-containing protein [Paracoccus angustae]|uniref:Fasciclin domain-containing protein n=1 Tax=Paracoccus angustae TaxID=1671480 RepID=A0ABV7U1V2_9RHOB
MRLTRITAAAAATALLSSVAVAQDTPATVVDIVVNSEDHTTLETAVVEAGMAETLSGDGPFTIFAPTDAAFAALPDGALDAALAEESKDTLKAILGCHAVASKAMAADVIALVEQGGGSAEVTTVGNCRLNLTVADGTVRINDAVSVTAADLAAGNGVVHVIDGVLMPAM